MLVVSPVGITSLAVVPEAAMHPAATALPEMFSAAKMPAASAAALGADVPPNRNWWAGKLGPWFVWNM